MQFAIGDKQASRQARFPCVSPVKLGNRKGSGLSEDETSRNSLIIPRDSPLADVQKSLSSFHEHLIENSIAMIEKHYGHLVRDDAEEALASISI